MQRLYQLLIIIIGYNIWCRTYGVLNVNIRKNKFIKKHFLKRRKEIIYYEDDPFIRIHKRDIAVDTIKERTGGYHCYFGYPSFISIMMMKISLIYTIFYLHEHHHTSMEAFFMGIMMYNLFIVYEFVSFYKTHSFTTCIELVGVGLFFSIIIFVMNILNPYF